MANIKQIDAAIARYYLSLNKDYNNNFATYCNENGIDEETLITEMDEQPEDSMLVQFDDEFPFNIPPKNEESKQEFIQQLIRNCYNAPNIEFSPLPSIPQFNDEFFKIQQDEIEHFQQKLIAQCPEMYESILESEQFNKYILLMMAIGDKHKFDYLIHCVDTYNRDRVNNINDNTQKFLTLEKWAEHKKHFINIQKLSKIILIKEGKLTIEPYDLVLSAMNGFAIRSKSLFNRFYIGSYSENKINDSLAATLKYVCFVIDWIDYIIKKSTKPVVPFQIDLCVNYGKTKWIISDNGMGGNNDDDEEEDESEDDDNQLPFHDDIGDIKTKLEKNKFQYQHVTCDNINANVDIIEFSSEFIVTKWIKITLLKLSMTLSTISNDIIDLLMKYFGDSSLLNLCNKFRKISDDKMFPNYKRFVMLIDRRKRRENRNDLWIYECDKDCRDIPKNATSYWYFNASKKCLLPNINKVAIGICSAVAGSLLTFSFHITKVNEIRCYLSWNGQVIRFMAEDIKNILPNIFYRQYIDNEQFINNDKLTQGIIEKLNRTLIDTYFNAFYESYE